MSILSIRTQLDNQTDHWFEFDVVEGGFCPLRDLPPGKIRSVKLSRIIRRCRKYGSPNWPIRVMINAKFIGVYIHPRDDLLFLTRIVFRYESNGRGSYDLHVLGTQEKGVDYALRLRVIGNIFGKNSKWDKRPWVRIGQADSKWTRNLSETPSSLEIRNWSSTTTSPPRQERSTDTSTRSTRDDIAINTSGSSTTTNARDLKRVYRMTALKNIDTCVRISLLVLAFTVVASARIYSIYKM